MARRAQIAVIGYDASLCTKSAYEAARSVGRELARKGATLITGGLGGVMEGASRGAAGEGGIVIGIVPSEEAGTANEFCTAVIPSGMGYMRNFLIINAADALIIVGGGAGTLTEAAGAYVKGKPLVAVAGTGGVADEWLDKYFDARKTLKVIRADTPAAAVTAALGALSDPTAKK